MRGLWLKSVWLKMAAVGDAGVVPVLAVSRRREAPTLFPAKFFVHDKPERTVVGAWLLSECVAVGDADVVHWRCTRYVGMLEPCVIARESLQWVSTLIHLDGAVEYDLRMRASSIGGRMMDHFPLGQTRWRLWPAGREERRMAANAGTLPFTFSTPRSFARACGVTPTIVGYSGILRNSARGILMLILILRLILILVLILISILILRSVPDARAEAIAVDEAAAEVADDIIDEAAEAAAADTPPPALGDQAMIARVRSTLLSLAGPGAGCTTCRYTVWGILAVLVLAQGVRPGATLQSVLAASGMLFCWIGGPAARSGHPLRRHSVAITGDIAGGAHTVRPTIYTFRAEAP